MKAVVLCCLEDILAATRVLAWCLEQRGQVRDAEGEGNQRQGANVPCIHVKDWIQI